MGMSLELAKEYLNLFAKLDIGKTGFLEVTDFINLAKNKEVGEALFHEFDGYKMGKVSFRDFLMGGAILNQTCGKDSNEMAAHMVFNVLYRLADKQNLDEVMDRVFWNEIQAGLEKVGVNESNMIQLLKDLKSLPTNEASRLNSVITTITSSRMNSFITTITSLKHVHILCEIPILLNLYIDKSSIKTGSGGD